MRSDGGIPDSQMVGDTAAAVKWMRAQPNHNGKVGVFGSCSGGRHAFIYACQKKDVDACAELWGGRVVMGKEELNEKTPVAPIDINANSGGPRVVFPPLNQNANPPPAANPNPLSVYQYELLVGMRTLGREFRASSVPHPAVRERLSRLTIALRQIVIRVAPLLCEF